MKEQNTASDTPAENRSATHSIKDLAAAGRRWLWARPLLIVLAAHSLFYIGIWNARESYGEETNNVWSAFQVLKTHKLSASIYVDAMAFVLRFVTPDPLGAATFMRYFSSLLATVAMWIALRRFIGTVRQGALLFSCLAWIASAFNAPFVHSTSISLFTFGVMLLGVDCLLSRTAPVSFAGFCALGLLATAMRPEYFLPLVLGAGLVIVRTWRRMELPLRKWTTLAVGVALVVLVAAVIIWPPQAMKKGMGYLDRYALLGLGQCYAGFYLKEHPSESFDPATEYHFTLKKVFGDPEGFFEAARNNPRELTRYLALNATRNLFANLPKHLMGRYRETMGKNHGWLYWGVRLVLVAGGIALALRWYSSQRSWSTVLEIFKGGLRTEGSATQAVLLLGILAAASLPGLVLLTDLRRYYVPVSPLFFLALAFCVDSLVSAQNMERFQGLMVGVAVLCFCRPNYLSSASNSEMEALRQIAPLVRPHPVIAAAWAEPYAVLGLRGEADSISLWHGIREQDITGGRVDILLIDDHFRLARGWVEQRSFFEDFERKPEKFGFARFTNMPQEKTIIYYREHRTSN